MRPLGESKMRQQDSNVLAAVLNNHLVDYPTPSSISYAWGFGSLSGLALVIQIVTGVFVGMHYTGELAHAFSSVDTLMREVWGGWLTRNIHANGASLFFVVVYLHIARGLYYGSYMRPRGSLWASGVILFLLMVVTAFLGYVLPWGQMSMWGATVITKLLSAVPLVGDSLVIWLWGGYSVGASTLLRFYSLHFLLPFLIAGLALLHLGLLHVDGSSNRLGVMDKVDKIGFYPYCAVKDSLVFLLLLSVYTFLVVLYPNALGHSDNSIEANIMFTPAHIVPEWYFLPFYGILRSIPFKLGGVVMMLVSILCLLTLPMTSSSSWRSTTFRPEVRWSIWLFITVAILLGWLGQENVEWPFDLFSVVGCAVYFAVVLVWLPLAA